MEHDAIERALIENDAELLNELAGAPTTSTLTAPINLVSEVERFLRRFVVLPEAAYLTVSTWIVGTYVAQHFDCFPYLALLSPLKRCGKTRLLEVLEVLVRNPRRGTAPSPAALFRMMSAMPTLFLDEVEALNSRNKSETAQALLAILNAGHRKGATIPRCDGPRHEVKDFSVYGPKVFAAIGRLPDTLTDRSILVTMQRRIKTQEIERFLATRAASQAKPIRDALANFADAHQGVIEESYRHVLDLDLPFLGDRDADLWIPLFAICAVAAPDRVSELKRSSLVLSGAKAGTDADDSLSLQLLTDLKAVWPENEECCGTATLIASLRSLEESPWAEFELSPRKLTRMLKPFGLETRTIRFGERVCRGYRYDALEPAFLRYLEVPNATSATEQ